MVLVCYFVSASCLAFDSREMTSLGTAAYVADAPAVPVHNTWLAHPAPVHATEQNKNNLIPSSKRNASSAIQWNIPRRRTTIFFVFHEETRKKNCVIKNRVPYEKRFLYSLWAEERNVINIAFVEWEETYSTPNFKTPAHPNEKSVLNLKQEKWFQIFHYSKTTKNIFSTISEEQRFFFYLKKF